ncbi:MAG: leucine-rich repeat protein, partial [Eubacterium sp.]|nr:leucine-rich repeat protein [Eubacterium sp.]
MVYSKATAKPIKALLSSLLVVLLITMSVPFTAMAAVDDFFEEGSLMFLVTSEESGSEDCTVMAAFNENLDPETITEIKVPGTVKHDGKTYSVTALMSSAFGSCTSLKSLDMSECTGLVSIGMSAFVDCEKLTSISIPCNFNKDLFQDSVVVPDGDSYKIEYTAMGGLEEINPQTVTVVSDGKFTSVHDWKVNDKNYAQHKCTRCSKSGKHTWQADKNNASQHKCTVCQYAEAHYGGNADC